MLILRIFEYLKTHQVELFDWIFKAFVLVAAVSGQLTRLFRKTFQRVADDIRLELVDVHRHLRVQDEIIKAIQAHLGIEPTIVDRVLPAKETPRWRDRGSEK